MDKVGRESEKDQKLGRYADADSPGWARTGRLRTGVHANSLVLVMSAIFVVSWLIQSVGEPHASTGVEG